MNVVTSSTSGSGGSNRDRRPVKAIAAEVTARPANVNQDTETDVSEPPPQFTGKKNRWCKMFLVQRPIRSQRRGTKRWHGRGDDAGRDNATCSQAPR